MTNPQTLRPAEPEALTALAEYAAGSIVSRTLLKNAAGNITFFAFGKGEGLSPWKGSTGCDYPLIILGSIKW